MTKATSDINHRLEQYRELQRSIPCLGNIYSLMRTEIQNVAGSDARVLIVGAGGGREIEEFAASGFLPKLVAIDPSQPNLDISQHLAARHGITARVEFFQGTLIELPDQGPFNAVTSLLVMHHLQDDGSKLEFLREIRRRLAPNGVVIHADIAFDESDNISLLKNTYRAYAKALSIDDTLTTLELDCVTSLPTATPLRTCELFEQAGLAKPQEVFRSLWYRCWISRVRAA